MAGISVFSIIIDKFNHKKKPCSIILFEIDKSPKIGLHHIILFLDLAVFL